MTNMVGARGLALRRFAAQWLRDPRGIGSLVPSSAALAAAMARQVSQIEEGTILELGPGAGAITVALIEAGIAPHRLYLVERNPQLAAWLRAWFPNLRVVEGDAARLRALVEQDGIDSISAVVSSLPLRILKRRSCYRILHQAFSILGDDGSFFQFTYHRAPMPRSMVERLGLIADKVDQVWLNLPSASIWRFRLAPGRRAAHRTVDTGLLQGQAPTCGAGRPGGSSQALRTRG